MSLQNALLPNKIANYGAVQTQNPLNPCNALQVIKIFNESCDIFTLFSNHNRITYNYKREHTTKYRKLSAYGEHGVHVIAATADR